jgi:hypothetical protein
LFHSVANSQGVEIFAPETGYISFFNSPYYSHKNALAVDIYPNTEKYILHAPSPVEGMIVQVYEFKSPSRRYFHAPEIEKVVLIISSQQPDYWVRILHVNCELEVGTQVTVGDSLGSLERSGFFNFWTARHMHVEVRKKQDPLRAKGAFSMKPTNQIREIEGEIETRMSTLTATNVHNDYLLANVHGGIIRVGRFWGLGCTINHQIGILDCGLPHYGYGGVHLLESGHVKVGDSVYVWGMDIGRVKRVQKQVVIFKCRSLLGFVGTDTFRGFSLYVWLTKNKQIKLVPEQPFTSSNTIHVGDPIRFLRA